MRRALCHAIDRETLTKSIQGRIGTPAEGFTSPAALGFLNVKDKLPEYNPEKAKSMLADLGWEPGSDGILEKDGVKLQPRFVTYIARDPNHKELAEAIQAQLRQIGVDAKLSLGKASDIYAQYMTKPETFDVGMHGWSSPIPPDLIYYALYHKDYWPPKGWAFVFFSHEEYEKTVLEALETADLDDAIKLWQRCQEILAEEVPNNPIYVISSLRAMKTYVKNYTVPARPWWNWEFYKTTIEK